MSANYGAFNHPESEEAFDLLPILAAMNDIVAVLNSDGTIVSWSGDLSCKKNGASTPSSVYELAISDEANKIVAHIREALENRKPITLECALCDKQTHHWCEGKIFPIGLDTVLWLARDVSTKRLADEEVHFFSRLEKLIANISTRFINMRTDNIDEAIEDTLGKIGSFADVERSYVFLYSTDGMHMSNTHEWCAEGIEPQKERIQHVAAHAFPWIASKLSKGEVCHIPRVADLPDEAHLERDEFKAQAILSLILFPMIVRSRLVGFLGFDSVKRERSFSQDLQHMLKMVGNIILNAIERKIVEEARIRSEDQYRQVVESASEVIYSTTKEGYFKYANAAAIKAVGYTLEELQRIRYTDLVLPEHRDSVTRAYLIQMMRKQQTTKIRFPFRTKSGDVHWFSQNATLIQENGEFAGFHVIARDITSRALAESALRESEARYRNFVENAADIIVTYDLKSGEIMSMNPAFESVTGWSIKEWMGRKFTEFVVADDLRKVKQSIVSIMRGNSPPAFEFKFRSRDGTLLYGEVKLFPLKENGKIFAISGIIRDTTAVTLSAERIKEQAALLDNAPVAIFVTDLDQRIRYWNKSAEQMFGWDENTAIEHSAAKLLFENDLEKFSAAERTVFESGEWSGQLNTVARNGRRIILESRITLVHDQEGRPRSILFINSDITEKKSLESQFLRAQRMESLGTLAGGIAHDLNNVMATVLMSLCLLRDENLSEAGQSMIDTMETSIVRGAEIVKQVLTFARGLEGDKLEIEPHQLVKEMEKILRQTLPKSINIALSVPADRWRILGDATQIHQVLMNLCVNARDAMPGGGTLKIELANVNVADEYAKVNMDAKPGPYVVLTVTDTGTGMPPHVLERIFEPFFTTKDIGKGTGLGLSTALAIVKGHGGFLNVYSEANKGTQFKIYLPAVETPATIQISREKPTLPRGNGELVLIVDDEPGVREVSERILTTFGYRVIATSDGTEALAVFAEKKDQIDIVITDMMMPHLDGPATIRALKRIKKDIKIIASSGLAINSNLGDNANEGIEAFLHKPYATDRLLGTLDLVLRKHRAVA